MAPVHAIDLANTTAAYYAPATATSPSRRLIHVSGQPGSTKSGLVPSDYESQIHLALLNLHKILVTAGASVRDIAKLTVFIVGYDPARRKHTKHIQRFLRGHRPAITLVPVQQLAASSWLFEVDAVVQLEQPPTTPPSVPKPLPSPYTEPILDVVIIGAGLAGLSAAESVLKSGHSCIVLEARDRVGGKTWSVPLKDGSGLVDLGAAWINDTNQSKAYELAKRVGAEMIVQNTTGSCVLEDFEGSCSTFPYGELPRFDPATAADIARIRDMCEADCLALSVWKPTNQSLDSLTFEAYLRSRGASEAAVATATVWTRAMLGQEPNDISALYFLNYCVSGGGLLQMRSDRKDGGQYLRIRQGTQSLANGLASQLPAEAVRLSSPVTSIAQHKDDGNVLIQAGGKTYSARKVISTVPGPVLKTISFTPSLPPAKRLWLESSTYGYYTKAMMVFKTPFWVSAGFCGLAQSFTGPAAVIRDSCLTGSKGGSDKAVLTCFMTGEPGRAWAQLSPPERERALCAQIGKLFGKEAGADVAAREFVEMATYEWTGDEFAGRGCPCAALTPGVLDAVGPDALRAPCGNLHFAGTETAGEWKGYMEGALRSGERAAKEVVTGLGQGEGTVPARL